MKINEKVRYLREANNWSQEEMAHKLSMSTNGYSKIERGETQLNFAKLEVIARVFGIDVLELMATGEDKKIIILNSQDSPYANCSNYFGGSAEEQDIFIKMLQQQLSHKDELLKAKQTEIDHLNEIIQLLKSKTPV